MDKIEQQTRTFQHREARLVKIIAGLCFSLLTIALIREAKADEYIFGHNYYPCSNNVVQGHIDCRPAGEKTPLFKRVPFVNSQTGQRTLQNTNATVPVTCDNYGCAVNVDYIDGMPRGTMMGQAKAGHYLVEVGWYLDFNADGTVAAYVHGVGPMYNQPRFGEAPPKPANYGTEACYDDYVKDVQSEYPNMAISHDMMREWRQFCGLE